MHEVENDKLGWREPKSDGRKRRRPRQDRHLPLPDRRRTVRLRRARPRPGDQAAPDPAPPARLPGPRQRLQRLRVPGHDAAARPRGDARPRVQPHPPVRLRRLPGRLVRRVDRDLDGGPGLQRHQRLPALRAALGQALRHAADHQLDQGVRLGGLERSGWHTTTATRSSARPGRGRSTPGPAASRSTPTKRRSAPSGPPTSATTSPASPPTSPSGAPASGFRESRLYPDMPRQGRLPLDGQPLTRLLNHTTFTLLRVRARRRPRRRRPRRGAARGSPPAWPWSAGSAANATAARSPASTSAAAAASSPCASATRVASAASPPSSSTPTPRRRLQRPPRSTGAT